MAVDDAREALKEGLEGPGLRWRGSDWWRAVALLYGVVAVACAAPILTYAVGYWLPCFGAGYDSPICLELQSHDVARAFTYDGIGRIWLVAVISSLVTAGLCWRTSAPPTLVVGAPLLLIALNPVGDYFITPLVNGWYGSHDAHPGSGIPMGAAITVSGLAAVVAAMTTRGTRSTTTSASRP